MLSAKIYGICLVKDEDDIIGQSLTFARQFCEKIYVIDNCSNDQTWDIVQSLAREYRQIVPWSRVNEPFDDGLRALVYNQVHSELTDDEWWFIVDSDEFLAEDPRPLIQQASRENADIIRSWQIHFYFTDVDYQEWLYGKDTRERPIHLRRRYYLINWQETRLFRNLSKRPWNAKVNRFYPDALRKDCRRRILNRHYQFRDPEQIQKRLSVRFGQSAFKHVTSADWRSVIVPSKRLNYHKDGEPWHFSATGLAEYYKITSKNLFDAAVKKLINVSCFR
jgi:hypothetical protein